MEFFIDVITYIIKLELTERIKELFIIGWKSLTDFGDPLPISNIELCRLNILRRDFVLTGLGGSLFSSTVFATSSSSATAAPASFPFSPFSSSLSASSSSSTASSIT